MCGEINRGKNLLTRIKVTYKSGRVEYHQYSTKPSAEKFARYARQVPGVKRVTILKKKVRPIEFTESG